MRTFFLSFLFLVGACDGPADPDAAVEALDAGIDAAEPPVDAGPPPPATLSEAGLFAGSVGGPLADGVLTYDVRYPLWTDALDKRRHLLLPPGTSIDTSDPDHWGFPEGTRLFKEFILDGRTLETRLLWKSGPTRDDWVYVAYRHRADGSDADPVPEGEADVFGTFHDVPDQSACRFCHRGGGDFVLGVGAFMLSRADFDAWVAAGVLPADAPYAEPPGTDVERAALGYLHGNCGHCHDDVHPLAVQRTLRLRLFVGTADAALAPAWTTGVGVDAFHEFEGIRTIIVPGDPDGSQLVYRMARRDDNAMPPLGTEMVDEVGLAAVRAWILAGTP